MNDYVYPVVGAQIKLPFYLVGCGIADPEYHVIREEGLQYHQFLYTQSGEGILNADGKTISQRKGDFFYLSPGIPHEYYPEHSSWVTCWVCFNGEYIDRIMENMGFPPFLYGQRVVGSKLEHLFARILNGAKDPVSGGEQTSELLYEYMIELRRILILQTSTETGMDHLLADAITFIDQNYASDINLNQLAGMCHISRQHFCRIFKTQMAMRPMEYLAQKRITESKPLLLSPSLCV